MAAEYNTPPWVVEKQCTEHWFKWWAMYQDEKNSYQEKQIKSAKR
jgi:hypothetical protein